ncbi:SDR family oxidoreductase [Haloarcula nitratireducens]|uniref:SDR family oxidoreductase n=1 Tax=Haloarcula nitratireducens TaxID=2487749 RepID=A0AAW4PH86_9EURY|nr:SDR family oxidoreductase [Halomicroarcula nitratireducens]MBX0297452.1 SDR family oxidoreductase [Halomicroarcula nitratireducens]
MDVAVIGANGGIGRKVVSRLANAGHDPIGVVRHETQFEAVRERGGEPRLGDLEGEFAPALEGADAVVFTAGAGGDTGWDKTLLVDLWGARRSIDACVEHDIDRFVMISSYRAGEPLAAPDAIRPYLVAKRCADDALRSSSLDATVLRPTTLTDGAETGRISAAFESSSEDGGEISRANVAQTVVACLDTETVVGETIRLFGGDTPIEQALDPNE